MKKKKQNDTQRFPRLVRRSPTVLATVTAVVIAGTDCDKKETTHSPGHSFPDGATSGRQDARTSDAQARPAGFSKFNGNFLIIFMDALREDRLGIENYKRKITPNIDRLISQSVFFRKAYTQGSRTAWSFGALVTSRYASKIKWKDKTAGFSPLKNENILVFEPLKPAGFRNAAVLRHYYFNRVRNLAQGFARDDCANRPRMTVRETQHDISSPDITRRDIRRLKAFKSSRERF